MYDVTTGARKVLGNGAQLLPGSRAKNAAPGPDQRPLGAREHTRRLLEDEAESGTTGAGGLPVETVDPQVGLTAMTSTGISRKPGPLGGVEGPSPCLGEKLGDVS